MVFLASAAFAWLEPPPFETVPDCSVDLTPRRWLGLSLSWVAALGLGVAAATTPRRGPRLLVPTLGVLSVLVALALGWRWSALLDLHEGRCEPEALAEP